MMRVDHGEGLEGRREVTKGEENPVGDRGLTVSGTRWAIYSGGKHREKRTLKRNGGWGGEIVTRGLLAETPFSF